MQRSCDQCGKPYEAKRATSKYCSSGCRTRVSRAGGSKVVVQLAKAPAGAALSETIRRRLEEVDRLDTVAGQHALLIVERLERAASDSGSSFASLSKELRAVMDLALEGVSAKADPIDELRRRREAKQTG